MKLTNLLILFLLLSLKGFSQQAPSYTLKYDKTEFCAGANAFSNPIVMNDKNEILSGIILKHSRFSYTIISGVGKLSIDENGKIDQSKSDVGKYLVQFKFGQFTSNISFNVNNCK